MAEGKIKVFHVLTDRNIGGAGRWLLNYLKYHDKDQFDVWVILPEDSDLYPAVAATDVAVIPMSDMADKSYDKKAKRALKRLFQEEKPHVVHTHASLTARMAAKEAGVPVILNTKHCMEGAAGSLPKKLARRITNQCYSDKIIAVSKAVKRSMIAGGTSPKQIVTIYNGIQPLAPISKEERRGILLSYGGDPEKKAVGIVARLEDVKDHNTFLLGAKELLDRRQDIQFYIVGDGSLRTTLEEKTKELHIEDGVIFTGFVKEVERLEAAFDLAVITSKAEALCLSIIESMSVGIPAVGTDSGGVAEVICHGANGYLVPVGEYIALAQRMEELLDDAPLYERMSVQAKAWVATHFTAQKMTKKIEQLYLEEQR